jgi:sRNA-binding protein
MRCWTKQYRYLKQFKPGAERVDLDGNVVAVLDRASVKDGQAKVQGDKRSQEESGERAMSTIIKLKIERDVMRATSRRYIKEAAMWRAKVSSESDETEIRDYMRRSNEAMESAQRYAAAAVALTEQIDEIL